MPERDIVPKDEHERSVGLLQKQLVQGARRPDKAIVQQLGRAGRAMAIGAKSPNSLYDPQLASFSMEGYDVTAARGFIDLFGLPMKVASQSKKW